MSQLFTFVLDFDGGTYLTQESGTLEEAREKWLLTGLQNLESLSTAARKELMDSFAEDEATLVNNVRNVWCLSGLANGRLAMLHIVKTDRDSFQNPKSKI